MIDGQMANDQEVGVGHRGFHVAFWPGLPHEQGRRKGQYRRRMRRGGQAQNMKDDYYIHLVVDIVQRPAQIHHQIANISHFERW